MPTAASASPIDDLCRLARLRLADAQRQELAARLAAVMQSFAGLREVQAPPDLDGKRDPSCRLRADDPEAPFAQEQALANASRVAGGCFLVPRVVEG